MLCRCMYKEPVSGMQTSIIGHPVSFFPAERLSFDFLPSTSACPFKARSGLNAVFGSENTGTALYGQRVFPVDGENRVDIQAVQILRFTEITNDISQCIYCPNPPGCNILLCPAAIAKCSKKKKKKRLPKSKISGISHTMKPVMCMISGTEAPRTVPWLWRQFMSSGRLCSAHEHTDMYNQWLAWRNSGSLATNCTDPICLCVCPPPPPSSCLPPYPYQTWGVLLYSINTCPDQPDSRRIQSATGLKIHAAGHDGENFWRILYVQRFFFKLVFFFSMSLYHVISIQKLFHMTFCVLKSLEKIFWFSKFN